MRNPLAAHPPWRQLLIISIALPSVIVLGVLAFAWPAGRIAPRDLPVGIIGTTPTSQAALVGLSTSHPRAFDLHLYADDAEARAAIKDRRIYGAFSITPTAVTVLEASAASPTVAQLLTSVGQQLAVELSTTTRDAITTPVAIVDVVATSADDPKGLVLSSVLLPLTICSVLIALAVAVLVRFHPAWRQLGALMVVSSVAALGVYLIAQGVLGALPHEHLTTWAGLALTMLAISSTTAGLVALGGPGGIGVSAILMVFVGNPFSGVTSAPQLLPDAVDRIGQWLPPGAGANLLRSTAYFDGHGAAGPLVVLLAWTVVGTAANFAGHHTSPRFAAHATHRRSSPARPTAPPSDAADVSSRPVRASRQTFRSSRPASLDG